MTMIVGSALRELLAVQREEDEALLYPSLRRWAEALIDLCRRLKSPIVWPVGAAADRLVGAAVMESAGAVRVRGWNDDLAGERVLLLAGVAVTPLGLYSVADQARGLGVGEVIATGIRVAGGEAGGSIDAFYPLEARLIRRRRTA